MLQAFQTSDTGKAGFGFSVGESILDWQLGHGHYDILTKPMAALVEPKDIARLLSAIDGYDSDFRTLCALKLLPLLMCRTGELDV